MNTPKHTPGPKKSIDELITQYACRVYEHIANEPSFNMTMAEFSISDVTDMLTEYAKQEQSDLLEALKEVIKYAHRLPSEATDKAINAINKATL